MRKECSIGGCKIHQCLKHIITCQHGTGGFIERSLNILGMDENGDSAVALRFFEVIDPARVLPSQGEKQGAGNTTAGIKGIVGYRPTG